MTTEIARDRPDGRGLRIAVVASKYHSRFTDAMVESACEALADCSVEDIKVVRVPGVFEIPLAANWLLVLDEDCDAVVALGCVIRGETVHFDQIVSACTHQIAKVSVANGVPVTHGIVAAENEAQAEARCLGEHNRAVEAAVAAVDLSSTLVKLSQ